MSTADLLAVADWRRRIVELYAEVRREAVADPAAAHATWRAEREALYRGHAASPVPAGERAGFRAVHWPYADAWRSTAPLEWMTAPATGAEGPGGGVPSISFVPASVGAPPPLELVGHVSLALPGGSVRLPVLQLMQPGCAGRLGGGGGERRRRCGGREGDPGVERSSVGGP